MATWTTWQILDSAFPTGGFAHSAGLEAAWQQGEVPDEPALERFVRDTLWQAGWSALPYVTAAYGAPERFGELDALCDVWLTSPVANRASRVQGAAFVATCARVWPLAVLEAFDRDTRDGCRHYAPASGAVLRLLGVPRATAHHLHLFTTARGVLAAAVRLGITGSYRAQQMLSASAPCIEAVAARCGTLGPDEAAQAAPLLDLLQAAHDRLYSRLFQS